MLNEDLSRSSTPESSRSESSADDDFNLLVMLPDGRIADILQEDEGAQKPFVPSITFSAEENPSPDFNAPTQTKYYAVFDALSDSPQNEEYAEIRRLMAFGDTDEIIRGPLKQMLLGDLKRCKRAYFDKEIDKKLKALRKILTENSEQDYTQLVEEINHAIQMQLIQMAKDGFIYDIRFIDNHEVAAIHFFLQRTLLIKILKAGLEDPSQLQKIATDKYSITALSTMDEEEIASFWTFIKTYTSAHFSSNRVFLRGPDDKEFAHLRDTGHLLTKVTSNCTEDFKSKNYRSLICNILKLVVAGLTIPACIIFDIFRLLRMKIVIKTFIYPLYLLCELIIFARGKSLEKSIHKDKKDLKDLLVDAYTQAKFLNGKDSKEDVFLEMLGDEDCMALFLTAQSHGFPLPEKTKADEVIEENKPNIFVCGICDDSLALAREVDRQTGANVIVPGTAKVDGKKLTVKRGGVYKNGKIYWVKFDKPIQCDYVFSPMLVGDECIAIQEGNIPASGIPNMLDFSENKEISNGIVRQAGVRNAPSLCWQRKVRDGFLDKMEKEGLVQYQKSREKSDILKEVQDFSENNQCAQVVVKPTDEQGGEHVKFFTKEESEKITEYILDLLQNRHSVLLEKRIHSVPLEIDGVKKDWNLRVFVSRDENNDLKVSDMEVRIDDDGKPVNISLSASVMTYENIVKYLKISPEASAQLHRDIEETVTKSFQAIDDAVRKRHKIPNGAQQDWMGIDIIVQKEGDRYVPYVLEVNDHHAGGMWDLDNILPHEEQGRASRDLARVMIKRATTYFKQRKRGVS